MDDVDLVVQFDPPNDHKDYLHRSGRTARAGATGMVIALVERGQVRELQRLHDAAGVTAASDEVATGHNVVRQIATSGTPVPPPPVGHRPGPVGPEPPLGERPPRAPPGGRTRDGFARGTAKPPAGRERAPAQYDKRSAGRPRPARAPVTWSPAGYGPPASRRDWQGISGREHPGIS